MRRNGVLVFDPLQIFFSVFVHNLHPNKSTFVLPCSQKCPYIARIIEMQKILPTQGDIFQNNSELKLDRWQRTKSKQALFPIIS